MTLVEQLAAFVVHSPYDKVSLAVRDQLKIQWVHLAFRSEMLWMSRQYNKTILDNVGSAFNNPPIAVGMSIA